MELIKLVSVQADQVRLFHARSKEQQEVDVILEDASGRLVAIEIKATTSPGTNALRGLRWLKQRVGDRMRAGLLLHLGSRSTSHGEDIYSVPLSALWDHRKS